MTNCAGPSILSGAECLFLIFDTATDSFGRMLVASCFDIPYSFWAVSATIGNTSGLFHGPSSFKRRFQVNNSQVGTYERYFVRRIAVARCKLLHGCPTFGKLLLSYYTFCHSTSTF